MFRHEIRLDDGGGNIEAIMFGIFSKKGINMPTWNCILSFLLLNTSHETGSSPDASWTGFNLKTRKDEFCMFWFVVSVCPRSKVKPEQLDLADSHIKRKMKKICIFKYPLPLLCFWSLWIRPTTKCRNLFIKKNKVKVRGFFTSAIFDI